MNVKRSSLYTIPKHRQDEVISLTAELLHCMDEQRLGLIQQLIQMMEDDDTQLSKDRKYNQYCALFIQGIGSPICSGSSSGGSPVFDFVELINFFPIDAQSPRYFMLQKALAEYVADDAQVFSRFDQAQLFYMLVSLGDYKNAENIMKNIDWSQPEPIAQIRLILQIARLKLFTVQHRRHEAIAGWLELASVHYQTEGADITIYILLNWIHSILWKADTPIQMALLSSIHQGASRMHNLNAGFALYDMYYFSDSRSMLPSEKMRIASLLIKRYPRYLSFTQLHELHFYAGSYSTGQQSTFRDSIQYFKYSNFYLNRRWKEQASAARFLREMLSSEQFCCAMPFIERRIQLIGNQVSMHNNAFVESLQEMYNQVEDLFRQVELLSVTDSLTGLRNRHYLETNVLPILHLAGRHRVPIIFAMLDIDFFKKVNDVWGHPAGDAVLRGLAGILTEEFRKSDVIIRYGGEEFLILLFDSNLEDTIVKMEVLRAKVQEHIFIYLDQEIKITVSIGLNKNNLPVFDEKDMWANIKIADSALYKAKNSGRNQVCLE